MEIRSKKRTRADGETLNAWSQSQLQAAGVILTKITKRNADVVQNPDAMIRAMALKDRFLLAVTEGDRPATSAILRSLGRAIIDKEILKVTGLGHILNDRSLWKHTDEYNSLFAHALRQRWKTRLFGTQDMVGRLCELRAPLFAKGFRSTVFCDRVEAFRCWLLQVDCAPIAESLVRRLALSLVLHGFAEPVHLVGLIPSDLDEISDRPAMIGLLRRGIDKMENASALYMTSGHAQVRDGPRQASPASTLTSANAFGDNLNENMVKFVEKNITDQLEEMNIESADTLRPREFITKLAEAKRWGANVGTLLQERAMIIKIESSRKNLGSVASGLRAWHAFAVSLKGYPDEASLPPRCDEDVVEFISLFKSSKTAKNYISYVKWACIFFSIPTTWRSDAVQQALNGVTRRELRLVGGSKRIEVLMTEHALHTLVTMADNLQLHDGLQEVALLAWVFLLRVQSEALPLETGTAEEAKSAALGNGRHSAVWVNLLENTIHLRLARRKNRPNGSWLTRKCTCKESGLTLCCVHRMATYLAGKPAGSRLFPLTPPRFLATIQRMLKLLEFPWAANLTLKGFRARRATDMAKKGSLKPENQVVEHQVVEIYQKKW